MTSGWPMKRLHLAILLALGACQPLESGTTIPPREIAGGVSFPARKLTCSDPVRRGDTKESLRMRYGRDAELATLAGAEGSEFAGVVLWPADPMRRLEVFFAEDGAEVVTFVRLGEKSRWRVADLGLGDSLARVQALNGRPFTFWGFSWDYGGYVSDWAGGRLQRLPGGCTLSLRFEVADGRTLDDAFVGDTAVSSDDPGVHALAARVDEIGLGFPPAGPGK